MQTREGVTSTSELERLVAALADNKYFLGRRYAEWCTAAPTLESAVAAAAMAQDEIGHARSLYPVLRDLSGASVDVEPTTRAQFANARFLDETFNGWTDFVAANFLFDTAMTVLLRAANGTFGPLAQRARRMVEEEQLHWLHAEGWTRRLPPKGPAVGDALAGSLLRVAPDALAWFETTHPALVDEGILLERASSLRERFRVQVNRVLTSVELPTV